MLVFKKLGHFLTDPNNNIATILCSACYKVKSPYRTYMAVKCILWILMLYIVLPTKHKVRWWKGKILSERLDKMELLSDRFKWVGRTVTSHLKR